MTPSPGNGHGGCTRWLIDPHVASIPPRQQAHGAGYVSAATADARRGLLGGRSLRRSLRAGLPALDGSSASCRLGLKDTIETIAQSFRFC